MKQLKLLVALAILGCITQASAYESVMDRAKKYAFAKSACGENNVYSAVVYDYKSYPLYVLAQCRDGSTFRKNLSDIQGAHVAIELERLEGR